MLNFHTVQGKFVCSISIFQLPTHLKLASFKKVPWLGIKLNLIHGNYGWMMYKSMISFKEKVSVNNNWITSVKHHITSSKYQLANQVTGIK